MNVPRQCSAVSYFSQPRLQPQLRPLSLAVSVYVEALEQSFH